MLGLYSTHAQTYLTVLMVATTLAFALPIFLAPLGWARLVRWTIPEHTHLAIYFGRCLGALVVMLEVMMLRAIQSGTPLLMASAYDMLFVVFGLMVVVHVWGALRRIQPITETLEIGLWVLLLVFNTIFYPVQALAR